MKVHNKKNKKPKTDKPKKINPFELKFNKTKHDILGRKKLAKVGAPTVSRKRAHEQREKTLGVEYDRKNKISKIVDKRIGEKDGKTEEEKMALRFAEERTKNFKKASKFNLSDDIDEEEVLTHHGKALSNIEKYDKSMMSDSDDDDDPGNIGAKMVKIAHFGGGEKTTEEKVQERISRDDIISNLIAKAKVEKHDRQIAKDEMSALSETLDSKYLSLMSRVHAAFRPVGRQPEEKDDYDRLALELKTEVDAKATPSERKLTEEEMAAKEKERLEMLEAARIAKIGSHLSADADVDVEAGRKFDERKMKKQQEKFEVKFADGQIVDGDKIEKSVIIKGGEDEAADDDDEMDEDEEEEEDLDDLIEDEDELESNDGDEIQDKQGESKTADTSVPFTFEMPKNYRKFCELLEKYEENMEVVLERLLKCYHPSLKEGNKLKLNKMFLYCLRWYDDMAKEEINENVIKEMDLAMRSMHALMKYDIQYCVRCVRALIRQHWKIREENKQVPASFGLISLLKLVSGLFPVNDHWHPVVTPAFFLATWALSTAKISNVRALTRQTMLASTLLEFVKDSKRYVPEIVSFVRSALLLAVEQKTSQQFTTSGFPITKPFSEMLCIREKVARKLPAIKFAEIFNDENVETSEELKNCALRAVLSLLQTIRVLYTGLDENFNIVFKPIIDLLKLIDKEYLSKECVEELEVVTSSLEAESSKKMKLTQLSMVKKESMLKMLEPRFEYDFDPERPRKGMMKNDKKKMEKQFKNEMRGAVKELRKDTAFLARKQLSEVKAKDRARMKTTKRLMGGLMQQQGEWNKEIRTKEVELKKAKKR